MIKQNRVLTATIKKYLDLKKKIDELNAQMKDERDIITSFITTSGDDKNVYTMDNGERYCLALSDCTKTLIDHKELKRTYPHIFCKVAYYSHYTQLRITPKKESDPEPVQKPQEIVLSITIEIK